MTDRTVLLLFARRHSFSTDTDSYLVRWITAIAPYWVVVQVCKLLGDYGPPTELEDGTIEYKIHGRLHRLCGAALILPNGDQEWYQCGRLHRDGDNPARIRLMKLSEEETTIVDWWSEDGDDMRVPQCAPPDYERYWYKEGYLHRENDLPAVITEDGHSWYVHGKLHRDGDLPAVIDKNGGKEWWKDGEMYRLHGSDGSEHWFSSARGMRERHRSNDLPAVIIPHDRQEWWYHGKLHRENDLPAIIYANGTQKWYSNGCLHREGDKPAYVSESGRTWYKHGVRHRGGGLPAVVFVGGIREWFENGIEY